MLSLFNAMFLLETSFFFFLAYLCLGTTAESPEKNTQNVHFIANDNNRKNCCHLAEPH